MRATHSPAAAEWRKFWPLPFTAALGYAMSVLHLYSLGPFMGPLQQAFGWSRTQVSAGITITGLVGSACGVPVGMLVDRMGPRAVALIGVPLMAVAFALLGTATGSKANWFLLWSVVAVCNIGLQGTVWTSALASRFEASRGLAFAIAFGGASSMAASVFPLLATSLIGSIGWRMAFMAISGIVLVLVLPMMALYFRSARDRTATPRKTAHARSELPGLSVADALRSPSFHRLVMAGGLLTVTTMGIIVHFVPILESRGAGAHAAARIAALIGIASIAGRPTAGLLLDRFPGHWVGAGMCCVRILACTLLLFEGARPLGAAAAAACFGLTVGAEVDVVANLASRHFGLRNYGVLFGVIISAFSLGVALGPLAAAAAYDRWASYTQFLAMALAILTVSALALLTLSRPPYAGQRRDEVL
jgi:MFS family permease